jgi:hypothetical protein
MKTMTMHAPYRNEGLDKVYNLLFCDQPELFNNQSKAYPWNILVDISPSTDDLNKIIEDESTESRAKLLAGYLLTKAGEEVEQRLLGVVVEVGLENGLDVLAAYDDGSARYINQSGKMVIWEARSAMSDALIDQLFEKSADVVSNIGPWDKERLPAPKDGEIRISFLVSGSLYFGQGPFDVLERDPMGGPVIHAATQLMIFLTKAQ